MFSSSGSSMSETSTGSSSLPSSNRTLPMTGAVMPQQMNNPSAVGAAAAVRGSLPVHAAANDPTSELLDSASALAVSMTNGKFGQHSFSFRGSLNLFLYFFRFSHGDIVLELWRWDVLPFWVSRKHRHPNRISNHPPWYARCLLREFHTAGLPSHHSGGHH